jgi:hypothetical protein
LAHHMHAFLFRSAGDMILLSFPVQSWLEWSQLAHTVLRAKWFCMLLQFLCLSVSVFTWILRHCCSVAGSLSKQGLFYVCVCFLCTSKWSMPLHTFFVNCIAGGESSFCSNWLIVLLHAPHVPTVGPHVCWPITEQAGVAMTL